MDATVGYLLVVLTVGILGVAVFLAVVGLRRLQGFEAGLTQLGEVVEKAAIKSSQGTLVGLQRALPQLYQPVEAGLTELRSVLPVIQRSADDLSSTVQTLNGDGNLGEWVENFGRVVEPLQVVSGHFASQAEAMNSVLVTVGRLFDDWAAQKEAVQQSFARLSSVLEQFSAREQTHLRDIEGRLMARLKEVAHTNATLTESFSQMQTTVHRTSELITVVEEQSKSTGDMVREVQSLLSFGGRVLREQHEIAAQFRSWQVDMGEAVTALQEGLRAVPAELTQALRNNLQPALAEIHNVSVNMARAGKAQSDAAVAQRDVLDRLAESPTRRNQLVLIGLAAGVNLLLLVILAQRFL